MSGRCCTAGHAFHKIDQPNHPTLDRFNEEAFRRRLTEAKKNLVLMDGCPAWLENSAASSWATPGRPSVPPWPGCPSVTCGPTPRAPGTSCKPSWPRACHHSARRRSGDRLAGTSDAALFRTQAFADGCFEGAAGCRFQLVAAASTSSPACGSSTPAPCRRQDPAPGRHDAGQGRPLAMDVEEWKLENLAARPPRRCPQRGDPVITSSKTVKRRKESADRVLLDVPCSGLGVLKRNPDVGVARHRRAPAGAGRPAGRSCSATARW